MQILLSLACGFDKFVIAFWSMFCFAIKSIIVIPTQLQMLNIIQFHKLEIDLLWEWLHF